MKMRSAKAKKPLVENTTIIEIEPWSVEEDATCLYINQAAKQKYEKSDNSQKLLIFLNKLSPNFKQKLSFKFNTKTELLATAEEASSTLYYWDRIIREQKTTNTDRT